MCFLLPSSAAALYSSSAWNALIYCVVEKSTPFVLFNFQDILQAKGKYCLKNAEVKEKTSSLLKWTKTKR